MVVMIRAEGEAARLIPAVRRRLVSADGDIAVRSLRPFEQWMGATLQRRRFATLLLALFAGLALTLSTVGIYGVLIQWVWVRQKKIAIRLALGATDPVVMVAAAGMVMAVASMAVAVPMWRAGHRGRDLVSIRKSGQREQKGCRLSMRRMLKCWCVRQLVRAWFRLETRWNRPCCPGFLSGFRKLWPHRSCDYVERMPNAGGGAAGSLNNLSCMP